MTRRRTAQFLPFSEYAKQEDEEGKARYRISRDLSPPHFVTSQDGERAISHFKEKFRPRGGVFTVFCFRFRFFLHFLLLSIRGRNLSDAREKRESRSNLETEMKRVFLPPRFVLLSLPSPFSQASFLPPTLQI